MISETYVRPFCSYVVRLELHFGVIFIAILGTAQASQPSQSQRSGVTSLHGFFSNEVTHSFPFTMAVGYPKRGRRAGVKTRAEEARKQFNIPVISSPCFQYANLHLTRGVNFNNLVAVSKTKPSHQNRASVHFVPRVMLANTMSLVPKLDEVQELLLRLNVQVGCIVESWLKQHINDSVVNTDGYNIVRKDRSSHEHGGVCIYIQDHIKFEIPENLQCCNDHEIIWLKLNPPRTPRGFSCIIFGLVYYPGRTSPAESDLHILNDRLFESLTLEEAAFPNCGIILTGDFNRLNTSCLQKHFKLKQLVKFPTRGNATLDLFLTNMGDHFATPELYPPFGLSDHCTVFVRPKERIPNQKTRKSISIRDKRDSNKARLGRYFRNIDWSCVTYQPSRRSIETLLTKKRNYAK